MSQTNKETKKKTLKDLQKTSKSSKKFQESQYKERLYTFAQYHRFRIPLDMQY